MSVVLLAWNLLLGLLFHQVRTTGVVTRVHAGTAPNVLPQTATVSINFRLLPGHTADTAVQLVKGWLGR